MKANRNGTWFTVYVRGGRGFHGDTLSEAMAQVRSWKAAQDAAGER